MECERGGTGLYQEAGMTYLIAYLLLFLPNSHFDKRLASIFEKEIISIASSLELTSENDENNYKHSNDEEYVGEDFYYQTLLSRLRLAKDTLKDCPNLSSISLLPKTSDFELRLINASQNLVSKLDDDQKTFFVDHSILIDVIKFRINLWNNIIAINSNYYPVETTRILLKNVAVMTNYTYKIPGIIPVEFLP